MPSKPKEGETEQEFMGRCMGVMSKESKYPREQQVAICFSMWKQAHPKSNEAKSEKKHDQNKEEEKKKKHDRTKTT